MNNLITGKAKKSFLKHHKYTFLFLMNFVFLAILKEVYVVVLAVALIAVSLKKSERYLPISLLLLSIMIFLNPFLGSLPSPLWNLALILFSALFIVKKKFHFNKLEISYGTILLSFLVTSLLVSPLPSIAIIKVISLTIFSYVVFKTYKWGDINELILRQLVESIVIGNIMLYFTSFGYYINGLFMGIFNHSQSIGLFLVPLLSYYTISFFENSITGKYEKVFAIIIIFLGMMEILGTYSRTAIFTYVALIIIYVILNKLRLKKILFILKNPFYFLLSMVILGVVTINTPKILNSAQNYIYKSYSNDMYSSQRGKGILSSRQELFDESLSNFKNNPIFGNGFGVQFHNGKLANNKLRILPLLYLPYTMVNEKGNVYLMVLEEGGLITFTIFILFLFLLLRKTQMYKPAFYASISILVMFNGEATLFSLNGVGAFQFVFLILLYFLAIQNKKLGYSK